MKKLQTFDEFLNESKLNYVPKLKEGDRVKIEKKLSNAFARLLDYGSDTDWPLPGHTYKIIGLGSEAGPGYYGFKDEKDGQERWHEYKWIDDQLGKKITVL